jgi:peptidoglycan DL-endopeptidase CwlO
MPGPNPAATFGGAAAGLFAVVVLIPTVILGGGGGGSGNLAAAATVSQTAAASGGQCIYTSAAGRGGTAADITLTASQLQIAGAGVEVAKQRKLPAQASVDIIAAGMQESHLTNLSGGDQDSVGWLQQRPSQGWGTVAQLMDPVYAAGKFFDKLAIINGWQTMAPANAIQAVQRSGDVSLYAQWVPLARALAASLLGDSSVALQCAPGGAGSPPSQAPNPKAGQVLARARAELGLPYCWAGGTSTGPSHGDGGAGCGGQTVGFDCSGLALYAYAGIGVPLPHSAADQYQSAYGHLVSISQVQPGDLVFWTSNGSQAGIHHVAIVWSTNGKSDGGGQLIEAQDFNVPAHIRTWSGIDDSSEVMPYAWRLNT